MNKYYIEAVYYGSYKVLTRTYWFYLVAWLALQWLRYQEGDGDMAYRIQNSQQLTGGE